MNTAKGTATADAANRDRLRALVEASSIERVARGLGTHTETIARVVAGIPARPSSVARLLLAMQRLEPSTHINANASGHDTRGALTNQEGQVPDGTEDRS